MLPAITGMLSGGAGGIGGDTSSTGPVSTRGGGIASQNYYFGGNPNVAGALQNPWLIGGAVVLGVVALLMLRRK